MDHGISVGEKRDTRDKRYERRGKKSGLEGNVDVNYRVSKDAWCLLPAEPARRKSPPPSTHHMQSSIDVGVGRRSEHQVTPGSRTDDVLRSIAARRAQSIEC